LQIFRVVCAHGVVRAHDQRVIQQNARARLSDYGGHHWGRGRAAGVPWRPRTRASDQFFCNQSQWRPFGGHRGERGRYVGSDGQRCAPWAQFDLLLTTSHLFVLGLSLPRFHQFIAPICVVLHWF